MRKVIFVFFVFILISKELYSQNFNVPDFQVEKIGTYVPLLFINEFIKSNNYKEAMQFNKQIYYDIIAINKNIVYSNLQFHDQFTIKPEIVKTFVFNNINGIYELIDNNGYKYVKISNDINYYRAFRIYVNNHFQNILNNFVQNVIIKTDEGFIYNEKMWIINLDVKNYPKNSNFMYFNQTRNGEKIGINIFGKILEFYKLEEDIETIYSNKEVELLLIIK